MSAADEAPPTVDRDVWLACAVPLSRLPTVSVQVYYFPHGHAEQGSAHLPAPLPDPPLFLCTVNVLRLAADARTNEVFAAISLQPGRHPARPQPQSDANNGGGFSVPCYCADCIFPRIDLDGDPPVQTLRMRDPCGDSWAFRHIYRGAPRRHLLTTGWSKFVSAKLLVAGDNVVLMRRPDGEFLIGLRRAGGAARFPLPSPSQAPPRNARARVPPEDVLEAARSPRTSLRRRASPPRGARSPSRFRRPAQGGGEDALTTHWEPGMQVRMPVMEAEDARRTAGPTAPSRHPTLE
ncbi:hypothetical protein ACP70R_013451 [Stipagrostis hirtigluma subsp. patula]